MEFYCKIKVFPPLRCSLQLHTTPPSSPLVFALCFQPRPPWRAGSSHNRGREGRVQGGRLQHGPGPGVLLQDQEPQHQVTGVSQQKVQRYGRYWYWSITPQYLSMLSLWNHVDLSTLFWSLSPICTIDQCYSVPVLYIILASVPVFQCAIMKLL